MNEKIDLYKRSMSTMYMDDTFRSKGLIIFTDHFYRLEKIYPDSSYYAGVDFVELKILCS